MSETMSVTAGDTTGGGNGPLTVDGGVTIDVDTESVRRLSRAIGSAYDTMRTCEAVVLQALDRAQLELAGSTVLSPGTAVRIPLRMAELMGPSVALVHAAVNLSLECDRVAAAYEEVEGRVSALHQFDDNNFFTVTGALSATFSARTARIESVHRLADRHAPRELGDLVDWFEPGPTESPAHPGRIDVIERTCPGPDGKPRSAYVVLLPGTTSWWPSALADYSNEPRNLGANLQLISNQSTPELDALPDALARAGVPPGAQLTLIGHSQGGMTAMAAAADRRVRSRYAVRHVITFGSPIARKTVPDDVRVLSVEHRSDPVPTLDLATNHATSRHITVQAGEDRPGPDGLVDHKVSRYAVTARSLRSSEHPSLAAFDRDLRDAGVLAPTGRAERDQVRVSRVRLTLNPAPGRPG